MTRVLIRRLPTIVIGTLVAAGVLLFAPVDASLTVRLYLLFVGAVLLATLVGATAFAARGEPSAFERALAPRRRRPERPDELERLERQVTLSVENAFDFHYRLRPALMAAAGAALWRRHGVELEDGERFVPAHLWAAVRPDLEPPVDRLGPGPSLAELDAFVGEIERMRG